MEVVDIDVMQLPIPDWDLRCPGCGYVLNGLPRHLCPECGHALNMHALVEQWIRLRAPRFNGDELPLPDFGLVCRACGAALAGAVSRACPACARPFDPADYRPRGNWFEVQSRLLLGLDAPLIEVVLQREKVPHFAPGRRSVIDAMFGGFMTPALFWVASEFYFEFLWLVRAARREVDATRAEAGPAWRCPACGEENPGNFELCWNCGSEKK